MKIKCPICNDNNQITELETPTFFACVNCGFWYKNPMSHLSSSDEKARYQQHENTIENKGYVAMFERFLNTAVLPFVVRGKVLDFGCGPVPVLAKLLKNEGFDVDVYDPYFYPNRGFECQQYDLITCTETCEHFNYPLEAFELMASLLKPEGKIALQTEFIPDIKKFAGWYYKNDPTHVGFYSRKVFEFIAEKLGLTILFCDDQRYCVLTPSKDVF